MGEKEKEIKIIKFIYAILNDERNSKRYLTTRFGDMLYVNEKTVGLSDCIEYLENKYAKMMEE